MNLLSLLRSNARWTASGVRISLSYAATVSKDVRPPVKDCLVVGYERFLAGACQCDRTYDADENLFFEKQIKFERCRRVNSIRVGDDSKNCRVKSTCVNSI